VKISYVFALILVCASSLFSVGNDKYVYIGVADACGVQYDFSGEPYDYVTFKAWITTRPTEVLDQNSAGAGYEDFDCGVSAVYLNAGSFPTPWSPGDVIVVLLKESYDDYGGYEALCYVTLDNSFDVILIGLDTWFGEGTSTDYPYEPISINAPYHSHRLYDALINVVDNYGTKFDFSSEPYNNVTFRCWISGREDEVIDQNSERSEYKNYPTVSAISISTYDFESYWNVGDTLCVSIKHDTPGLGYYSGIKKFVFTYTFTSDYWDDYIDFGFEGDPIISDIWVEETGIERDELPKSATLHQNYPNPFNPETEISFSLPKEEQVTLSVFNSEGQLVKELVNGRVSAGNHSINFSASDLNSGIYFYTLEKGSTKLSKKMLLIK